MPAVACGTGRCGTQSLSFIINHCDYRHATHKMRPHLPWKFNEELYQQRKQYFIKNVNHYDVASYYLPYVERFINDLGANVIILERPEDEVAKSFMRKANENHWANDERWGKYFPTYKDLEMESAIRKYWKHYYTEARRIKSAYPDKVMIVPMYDLNKCEVQDKIFEFIGIPQKDRRCLENPKFNASE